jgi:hypothetical protein
MARRTEGAIPRGAYGAGGVIVWDRGTYANATDHQMPEGLERGHLSFRLYGEKLRGAYAHPDPGGQGRDVVAGEP